MDSLRLIVGLGNPGEEYARTRHNAGFLAVDELGRRWRAVWKRERKFDAHVAKTATDSGAVLLCKPVTFMNASGKAVAALATFYRVSPADCLVVVDDADLPMGELRMRPAGSSGGHHGLESIEEHLGTREFPRLRIGIGRRGAVREITGHVLGRFSRDEAEIVEKVMERAANQAECWLNEGVQKAMNKFNGTVISPNNEGKAQ
jgi:PTH1 family peptidyl-tRNA hydrolase